MKYLNGKFVPGFVLLTLLLVVGGFCGVQTVSAKNIGMMNAAAMDNAHCGGDNVQTGIQKASPIGNTVAPCCVQRHDNSETVVPISSNDRVKFSPAMMTSEVLINPVIVKQKTYSSSPSPPPKADILSSVVKIE